MTETMRLMRCTNSFDENHVLVASYADAGKIVGRLAHSRKLWKAGYGEKRLLLITGARNEIRISDRIECSKGLYRVIDVRIFQEHLEAAMEMEGENP